MVNSTENVMKMKTIVVKKVRIIPHSGLQIPVLPAALIGNMKI